MKAAWFGGLAVVQVLLLLDCTHDCIFSFLFSDPR